MIRMSWVLKIQKSPKSFSHLLQLQLWNRHHLGDLLIDARCNYFHILENHFIVAAAQLDLSGK